MGRGMVCRRPMTCVIMRRPLERRPKSSSGAITFLTISLRSTLSSTQMTTSVPATLPERIEFYEGERKKDTDTYTPTFKDTAHPNLRSPGTNNWNRKIEHRSTSGSARWTRIICCKTWIPVSPSPEMSRRKEGQWPVRRRSSHCDKNNLFIISTSGNFDIIESSLR